MKRETRAMWCDCCWTVRTFYRYPDGASRRWICQACGAERRP